MKRCLPGLLCLIISIQSFGQTLESDRLALVAIYNATSTGTNDVYGGPNFNDITGWNVPGAPGDSPCGWTGVTCEGGRVTRLDLSGFQVHGPLASEVGNLSELKYLNIMQGGSELFPMTGVIPATLGNLQNLEYLDISGNVFGGTNMDVIGSLTKLTYLALNTPASWTIPNSFQNLVNLEHLYFGIRGNEAWPGMRSVGAIPSFFANYTKLKTLEMPWAGVESLPSELGSLTNLEVLDLNNNKLTGTIPAAFNNLTKLTKLDLSNNQLVSPIPNILGIPVSANVKINNNAFNFSGMETNISRLDSYGNQKKFQLRAVVPLGSTSALRTGRISGSGMLVAHGAGGTEANNTYKWYKSGALIATTFGNDRFVTNDGLYRVEVTNSLVPGLTMVSEDYDFVVLPVTLVSFEGKSENNQTKLTWKTAEEINNKGFEIERSADARTFEKIGFVDGSGNTKESQFYHFTDLNPLATSYYRLKQLDYDGKFEYSRVIAVKSEATIIKLYPNPAQEYLTVSGINGKLPISIVNQNGRVVLNRFVSAKEQINIGKLASGLYVVRIGNENRKLVINR
jgi:hypothetical protein